MSLISLCSLFEQTAIEEFVRANPFFSMLKQYTHADYDQMYLWFLKNEKLLGSSIKEHWFMDFREDTINFDNKIISKEKKEGLNFDKFYLMPGFESIPNMFYYQTNKQDVKITSPTLENNTWLIDYFKSKGYDKQFETRLSFCNTINQFAEKYKNNINAVASQIRSKPVLLGGGDSGKVYDIGDQKVLKLFRDKFSYDKAKEAMDRIFNNPILAKTEAKIYDVGVIGEFTSEYIKVPEVIYYYIMEKINPIFIGEENESDDVERLYVDPYKIKDLITFLVKSVISFSKEDKSLNRIKSIERDFEDEEVESAVNKAAGYILRQDIPDDIKQTIKELSEKERLKQNWLKLLVKEIIYKYLTGRNDLHIGNIGITPYGEFRYFDPAHESFKDKVRTYF